MNTSGEVHYWKLLNESPVLPGDYDGGDGTKVAAMEREEV